MGRKYEIAYQLAIEYHYLTEMYDRGIVANYMCDKNGFVVLSNSRERGLSGEYARVMRKGLFDVLSFYNIEYAYYKSIENQVDMLSFQKLSETYKYMASK